MELPRRSGQFNRTKTTTEMDPALETQNVWIHQNDPPENEPVTCPSGYFMATFEDDDVRFFFHVGYGFAPWKVQHT